MQLTVKGMQLKAMQLKVRMQKNIGERGSTRAIYVHSLFSSFFYSLVFLLSLLLAHEKGKPMSHTCIEKTPFLRGESFLVIFIS